MLHLTQHWSFYGRTSCLVTSIPHQPLCGQGSNMRLTHHRQTRNKGRTWFYFSSCLSRILLVPHTVLIFLAPLWALSSNKSLLFCLTKTFAFSQVILEDQKPLRHTCINKLGFINNSRARELHTKIENIDQSTQCVPPWWLLVSKDPTSCKCFFLKWKIRTMNK